MSWRQFIHFAVLYVTFATISLLWAMLISAFVNLEWLWPWEWNGAGRFVAALWTMIAVPVIASLVVAK